MRFTKTLLAAAIATTVLVGCNDDDTTNIYPVEPTPVAPTEVSIAAFNISFDHSDFAELSEVMSMTQSEQDDLIAQWENASISDDAELKKAEKVIQIRNIATIIQKSRPAAVLLKEFNNDGVGEDQVALQGFRLNYLGVPQEFEGESLEPIQFPYADSYSTNTGLNSGLDLDNNGSTTDANDAWGFGFFHGQYAFALLSQYPIDSENTRTFQSFKWKDMPGETNVAIDCALNDVNDTDSYCSVLPEGTTPAENWYTDEAWEEMRLSSKNHVDATILIPTENGESEAIHLLMSHPTPPIFDVAEATYNKSRNRAEIDFWVDYIDGADYIYDDAGVTGGLAEGEHFVVLGDLNADPLAGDGDLTSINGLMTHDKVNQLATFGVYAPKSFGGPECIANSECRESDVPAPEMATSTSGLRLDHVIPSATLNVVDSGVFWPATFEDGRILMNDDRLTRLDTWNPGVGKNVSSDHRMVWIKLEL
ncbi:endonuclease/exonuclease/phosphatase family protein [Ferrimonas lipolytica]|uniref:Endonuclease/exonuclease/phosphatase family protein n=1 Tax=Ferrimonas lipolytica TaxID=2724191 RepID=A0A6H1UKE5_9GAMM|nr:endonuclease/exonuclease/phosphatase family protein [Ferrimonas lipolytica]QIZ78696.1 endonuclease/exonuclease/phosphatase family protein [Ferrimonas lipolytica]